MCCQLLPHVVEDQGLALAALPIVLQQVQPHWGVSLRPSLVFLQWKWMHTVRITELMPRRQTPFPTWMA